MQYSTLLILALIVGCLIWISMPAIKHKSFAIFLYTALAIGLFISHIEFSGQARLAFTEWRKMEEIRLVGLHLDKGADKMWVWVIMDGIPVAYEFPYPEKGEAETISLKWKNREYSGDSFYIGEDGKVVAKQATPMPPKE